MRPNILISTGGGDAGNYLDALRAAGGAGEAQYLPAPDLSYRGLLLAGGADMDPALFGQADRAPGASTPPCSASETTAPGASTGPGTRRSWPCWTPSAAPASRCWPSAGAIRW